VATLTRTDTGKLGSSASSQQQPSTDLPVFGEVTLDKSLFIVVPIVAAAVLGLVTSVYVLANSGDAFVDAMAAAANAVPQATEECRGLGSSQQEDLESLKVVMNAMAGK
jgi:hypothetical protein